MTKPRKFTFELTLDTAIEGKRTLREWAHLVGVPEAQAITVANTLLDAGAWRAIPSVAIEFVKDGAKTPPQIEPKRRGRRTKAEMVIAAAAEIKSTSEALVPVIAAEPKKPNGRAASNPDELTWDVRMRSVSQMGREWDSDWGPAPGEYGCKCPANILSKYGAV